MVCRCVPPFVPVAVYFDQFSAREDIEYGVALAKKYAEAQGQTVVLIDRGTQQAKL